MVTWLPQFAAMAAAAIGHLLQGSAPSLKLQRRQLGQFGRRQLGAVQHVVLEPRFGIVRCPIGLVCAQVLDVPRAAILDGGTAGAASAPEVLEPSLCRLGGCVKALVVGQGAEVTEGLVHLSCRTGFLVPGASDPDAGTVVGHLAEPEVAAAANPMPVRLTPRLQFVARRDCVDEGGHGTPNLQVREKYGRTGWILVVRSIKAVTQ
jgi:hypothetical protein